MTDSREKKPETWFLLREVWEDGHEKFRGRTTDPQEAREFLLGLRIQGRDTGRILIVTPDSETPADRQTDWDAFEKPTGDWHLPDYQETVESLGFWRDKGRRILEDLLIEALKKTRGRKTPGTQEAYSDLWRLLTRDLRVIYQQARYLHWLVNLAPESEALKHLRDMRRFMNEGYNRHLAEVASLTGEKTEK